MMRYFCTFEKIAWDSIQATTNSPGSKLHRFWMAATRSSRWRWPSPKFQPITALLANSASRMLYDSHLSPR
ncbi:unannotated protein [freshwater metagenome]|uniref:Unannotated protein n=1 Tax=freshwater metagenome TaxID=449393 RepID=A0A6J7EU74_9ZZZZ